jgi:hypothetical protein
VIAPALTEGNEGESVSRRERALAELSIKGGRSAGKSEPVLGSTIGSGDGEVRDCSDSEAPNNARASACFLRVALESSSVEESATISVSVPSSVRILEVFNRGACMLSTTESRRALAFNTLWWDVARGGDPC